MSEQKLCLGVIIGARGVTGEVRIKTFTGLPEDIAAYGALSSEDGQRTFEISDVRIIKGQASVIIEGINDRDAAEALKGTRLYVPKSALPAPEEDEFYFSDLVGLQADLLDGGKLGSIKEVHDFGAGAILEVTGGALGVVIVPFTRAAVPTVDTKGGRVVIDPPPGLLEPAEPEAME